MLLFRYFLFVFVVLKYVYADTGCFETESSSTAISGCACHSTCQKCGYDSDPIEADDCVTCADGSHVITAVYADGTGTCARPTGCFETESSSAAISGCACHSTCQKCGYNSDPIEADDCVTCADGSHVITAVYADGTGTCAPPPPLPSSTSTLTGLLGLISASVVAFVLV